MDRTKLVALIAVTALAVITATWTVVGRLDFPVIAVVAVVRFFGTLLHGR